MSTDEPSRAERRHVEIRQLGIAEADIVAGETRVAEQIARIERLKDQGRDTKLADVLLATMQQTLVEWRHHRDTIFHRIRQIDADPI